jgi:hypothetical protein
VTKRVVLSTAAGGLAALDAGLADLAQDASGDSSMFLAGDGTFKPPGGSGLVQSVKMTITSAQILALNSSPITVIAAPGANKFIYVFGAVYRTHFGTTRYTVSDQTIGLYYPPASTGDIADSAGAGSGVGTALNSLVDSIVFTTNGSVPFGGGDGVSALANNSVVLSSQSADPTGGDGTMSLNVLYCVLDVS